MSLLIKDLSLSWDLSFYIWESNSPTLELSPTWIFKQLRSRTRQPLASSISDHPWSWARSQFLWSFFSPSWLHFSKTLEIPELDTLSSLLISGLLLFILHLSHHVAPEQRSPSDPNLSGSVPLAVVPSQTLPTAPPSRHRLTVKV